MRASYLHLVLLLLLLAGIFITSACSYCSGLDEYEDYTFGGQADAGGGEAPDAGGDGGMSSPDAGETWWERYDRLSLKTRGGCEELTREQLYCTGGVKLDVDLTCPERCHAVTNRHCFCPYKKDYEKAREICQSTGLQLVKIETWEENEILGDLIADLGIVFDEELYGPRNILAAAWIGLNDREQEGTFIWPDGTEVGFEAWAHNEGHSTPSAGEDCVALHVEDNDEFLWYDQPCGYSEEITFAESDQLTHFFFCETEEAGNTITGTSVAFLDADTDGCKKPGVITIPDWGDTCCTTLSDMVAGSSLEPGRCGTFLLGRCVQFCQPGDVDFLSGCRVVVSMGVKIPPCCTVYGDEDSSTYYCGSWGEQTGCSLNTESRDSDPCTRPTAYKAPDEPLVDWLKCGGEECTLALPQSLGQAEQCCTVREDVERFMAYEEGQCGLTFKDVGGLDVCRQTKMLGDIDVNCDSVPGASEEHFLAGLVEDMDGCCSEFGFCGGLSNENFGCIIMESNEGPHRLCVRRGKDAGIGVDPLGYGDYGNCDDPVESNGRKYFFCHGPLEWQQAHAACEWKKDRHLVRIDDAEENAFLHERFQDEPFWIGAREYDVYEPDDRWYWSGTEELFFTGSRYGCPLEATSDDHGNYVNWLACPGVTSDQAQPYDDLTADTMDAGAMDAGEADGGVASGVPKEECAQMRTDGFWSDEYCELKKAYVCEEEIP